VNISAHAAGQVVLCALLAGAFWLACAGVGLQILPRGTRRRPDDAPASWRQPGVAACVGLGALLMIGGVGVVLLIPWWLYVVPFLLIGLALAVRELIGLNLGRRFPRSLLVLGVVALLAVGLVAVLESLVGLRFPLNACDDLRAYMPMARRLLDTNGLNEPWSVRRAESLGGFDLLRALPVAVFGPTGVGVADTAIGSVFLAGLFLANGLRTTWTRVVSVGLIVAVPLVWVPRVNTTGVLLGSPLLVAVLAATLELRRALRARRRRDAARWAAAAGLVVATLMSVRPDLGLLGALVVAAGALSTTNSLVANRVRILAIGGASAAIAVGPWSYDMWRAVGTPLYPLFPGNLNSAALDAVPVGGLGNRVHGAFDLTTAGPYLWVALGVFVLGAVGGRFLYDASFIAIAATATVIVTAVFALNTPRLPEYTFGRYVAPMSEALAVFLVCEALRFADANALRAPVRRVALAVPVLTLSAAITLAGFGYSTHGIRWNLLSSGTALIKEAAQYPHVGVVIESPGLRDAYRQALAGVDGHRTLAAVDRPYLIDYSRYDVKNLDAPGFMTPDGTFPFFEGPGALIGKFRDAGFDTLLATDPSRDACLNIARMRTGAAGHSTSRGAYQHFLDWDQNISKIAQDAPRAVQRFGTLLRIDLRVAQETFSPVK